VSVLYSVIFVAVVIVNHCHVFVLQQLIFTGYFTVQYQIYTYVVSCDVWHKCGSGVIARFLWVFCRENVQKNQKNKTAFQNVGPLNLWGPVQPNSL